MCNGTISTIRADAPLREQSYTMSHHYDHYTALCLTVQTDTSMLVGLTLPNALYLFVNGQFHVLMHVK